MTQSANIMTLAGQGAATVNRGARSGSRRSGGAERTPSAHTTAVDHERGDEVGQNSASDNHAAAEEETLGAFRTMFNAAGLVQSQAAIPQGALMESQMFEPPSRGGYRSDGGPVTSQQQQANHSAQPDSTTDTRIAQARQEAATQHQQHAGEGRNSGEAPSKGSAGFGQRASVDSAHLNRPGGTFGIGRSADATAGDSTVRDATLDANRAPSNTGAQARELAVSTSPPSAGAATAGRNPQGSIDPGSSAVAGKVTGAQAKGGDGSVARQVAQVLATSKGGEGDARGQASLNQGNNAQTGGQQAAAGRGGNAQRPADAASTRQSQTGAAKDSSEASASPRSESPEPPSFEKLVRSIRLRHGPRFSSARIRLDPPELGRLDVQVRMEADRIGIRVRTESPAARALLQDRVAELRDALQQHGIRMDRFEITVEKASHEAPTLQDSQHARDQQGHRAGSNDTNDPGRPATAQHAADGGGQGPQVGGDPGYGESGGRRESNAAGRQSPTSHGRSEGVAAADENDSRLTRTSQNAVSGRGAGQESVLRVEAEPRLDVRI